ncbi:DUF6328 family protein [Kribbella deserti]|uniref:DUF6328 family protein n=1 Tax=Kribbella deserti TaxID=1926257 RepID=A0ABV6QPX2_9ACTN
MNEPPNAPYTRHDENDAERLDRQWNELLQELRLAQTGTQILFAFLLSIAFQPRFQDADDFTKMVFAGTLITSALAMGLFLAPVSFHRIVFQQRVRHLMIPMADKMAAAGLIFLVAAIAGGLLLALDVVLSRSTALIVCGLVLSWFVVLWYVVPAWVKRAASR